MKRVVHVVFLTFILFGPIGLTFLDGAQNSLDSWYARVNAQQTVPPPWYIELIPDTVRLQPPDCYATFTVHIGGTSGKSNIKVWMLWENFESVPIGIAYDGFYLNVGKPAEFSFPVRIGAHWNALEPLAGRTLKLLVWAFESEMIRTVPTYGESLWSHLAVLKVIVLRGASSCRPITDIVTYTTLTYTTRTSTTTTHTWTYRTVTYDWWDWYWWRDRWQWFWWWIVQEPFDFALDATPTTQSLKAGQSATFTVTVRRVSGAPQPVSLSLSGFPGSVSYSFSPASGTPTFTSALKVSSELTAPPGTYVLTITGTGGGKTRSATVSLAIEKGKMESSLSITVSPSKLKADEPVFAGGALAPTLTTKVELVYTRPDGFEMTKHVSTSSSGAFSDTFKPEMPGPWSIRARWPGDANHYGSESQPASFFVEAPPEGPPLLLIVIVAIILATVIIVVALLLKRRSRHREEVRVERSLRFCAECGAAIPKGSDYCPKCGKKTE